ncbi:hypothetical protein RUM43_001676 [Polyplax serrata]|uniref:Cadherin domain-containing protein n=1 Tax=Polyplax serrata TaxID=468196 RepID=A0AAN8XQN7_POLSC
MRVLLIPADLRPGSVVYRLRGTDAEFDYPLHFSVVDDIGKSIVRIENMPCNPTHTYCQANVFLTKKLEPDRVYDLIISLKDSIGRETKVDSTIKATRAVSHFEDIFPYVPTMIKIPESTKVGAVLDYVLARKNPSNSHHSYLELWGSEKFRIVQNLSTKDLTNGSIVLTGELDYEEKNMYTLHVFCLDPYTKTTEDTRNIAGFQLPVIVEDDQDKPPEFNSLPPVTKISDNLKVGDRILQIQAQDGDRGNPRPVRYKLVTVGNALSAFFNISEKTGEIYLAKPLEELATAAKGHQPILLGVSAEEMRKNQWEPPSMSAITQVALLLEKSVANTPPYFQNEQYSARIAENSPQGTPVVFGEPYSTLVRDDDSGKEGVFSLSLENNNGTFEISPTVGEQKAYFVIRVRNNELLDYEERPYVVFSVVAKEVTPPKDGNTPQWARANVTVYLDDQNDNPPVFLQDKYEAEIPENVTAGTVITQVQATDTDTGVYGKVFFTNILGNVNQSLAIDSMTGVITVATNNHGFDRESAQEYRLMVEAKDMEGTGNMATVPLIIKLLDVNDETPRFERPTFEFILQPNLRNFTSRAFVRATDNDAEKPNNIVRYEIISGNYENKFGLNEITGELFIRGQLTNRNLRQSEPQDGYYNSQSDDGLTSVIVLTVRAYDLGIPHRWTHTYVRIYPPESRARNMNFIVAGSNNDRKAIEDLLRQLTGGRISIQDIRPYTGRESGTDVSWKYGPVDEKSVVSATVFYDGNSYVDLNQVERKLTENKTQAIVEEKVTEYRSKNRVLFWLMMFFLILLLLILLTLILCCIWQGCCVCPLFEYDGKRIVSPMENLRFIAHERNKIREAKDLQALAYYGRKEAWSGRNGDRTITNYEQNPLRDKLVRQIKLEGPDTLGTTGATFRSHANEENGGPNIIYTREFIRNESDRNLNPTMVIEDVEINPYATKTTILRPSMDDYERTGIHVNVNSEKDMDSDSIRRHEVERGSDLGGKTLKKMDHSPQKLRVVGDDFQKSGTNVIKEYRVVLERPDESRSDEEMADPEQVGSAREHYYIKDGNAEILRLVTRGNDDERPESPSKETEKGYIKLEKGKDLIMKKFMEDQKQSSSNVSGDELQQQLIRRVQKEFEERHSEVSYHNRSVISETIRHLHPSKLIEVTSNYELDPRFPLYAFQNQETQSLPGQIEISTQTERDCGTQTEELINLRPPRRKVRSDNEFSDEEDSYEKDKQYYDEKAVEALDLGRGWVRREPKNFRGKKVKRHKMRTPILEEGEIDVGIRYDTRPAMFKMPDTEGFLGGTGSVPYTENKSSILRRRKMKEKLLEEERVAGHEEYSSDESVHPKVVTKGRRSRRDLAEMKREMQRPTRSESVNKLYEVMQELGEGELERIKMETKERAASLNRFYNALAAFEAQSEKDMAKAASLNSLKSEKASDKEKKVKEQSAKKKQSEKPLATNAEVAASKKKTSEAATEQASKEPERNETGNEKEEADNTEAGHDGDKSGKTKRSKYMDWYNDLNTKKTKVRGRKEKKKEDDLDSGIAMSHGRKGQQKTKSEQLLEKKSVFTIAYDGVRTKSIRPETNSSEKH